MAQRHLVIITKIIAFYSIFVIVMKVVFLFQQYMDDVAAETLRAMIIANFLISIPFILLAIIGFWLLKKEKVSMAFVIVGAAVIIGIRAYELQIQQYLQQILLN